MAGILFCPGDPDLREIKRKTHNLNVDYNATYEDEVEKRAQIIREIVGEIGDGGFMQGPIYFHYGKHTRMAKIYLPTSTLRYRTMPLSPLVTTAILVPTPPLSHRFTPCFRTNGI